MRAIIFGFSSLLALGAPISAYTQPITCDPTATSVATAPSLTQIPASLSATENFVKNPRVGADIVMLGDSIMAGWSATVKADFPEQNYWNFAVGGDKTQNLLWRLGNVKLTSVSPRVVVLLIGTNNLADPNMPGCAVLAGIEKVIERVQSAWPEAQIFPIGVLPRGGDFRDWEQSRTTIAKGLKDMASASVHPVTVDDAAMTCNNITKPALLRKDILPRADYYKCDNYADDNLHLQAGGYKIIREALRVESEKSLGFDIFALPGK